MRILKEDQDRHLPGLTGRTEKEIRSSAGASLEGNRDFLEIAVSDSQRFNLCSKQIARFDCAEGKKCLPEPGTPLVEEEAADSSLTIDSAAESYCIASGSNNLLRPAS